MSTKIKYKWRSTNMSTAVEDRINRYIIMLSWDKSFTHLNASLAYLFERCAYTHNVMLSTKDFFNKDN